MRRPGGRRASSVNSDWGGPRPDFGWTLAPWGAGRCRRGIPARSIRAKYTRDASQGQGRRKPAGARSRPPGTRPGRPGRPGRTCADSAPPAARPGGDQISRKCVSRLWHGPRLYGCQREAISSIPYARPWGQSGSTSCDPRGGTNPAHAPLLPPGSPPARVSRRRHYPPARARRAHGRPRLGQGLGFKGKKANFSNNFNT
jgi:hypothetical protein